MKGYNRRFTWDLLDINAVIDVDLSSLLLDALLVDCCSEHLVSRWQRCKRHPTVQNYTDQIVLFLRKSQFLVQNKKADRHVH
jgi:hypothetical protein